MRSYLFLFVFASMPFFWPLANGQKTQPNYDDQIYSNLWAQYAMDSELNPLDINIIVNHGEVLLHGEVASAQAKARASEIANLLLHVDTVKNYLHYNKQPTTTPDASKNAIAKQAMELDLKTRLMANRHLLGSQIDVSTINRTAFLEGTVNSKDAYDAVEKITRDTDGIGVVVNKLKIKPNIENHKDLIYQKIQRSLVLQDHYWLKQQVEHTLQISERVDAEQLDIEIVNGLVILNGNVASAFQKDYATEMIIDIVDVENVKNNLSISS